MDWTPEHRLRLIKAIAAQSLDGFKGETRQMFLQRVMFLCDMPDEFLEVNKKNYEDAIRLAKADLTVTL